ncbi:hypothetical protein D3C85_1313640 [compost metagenome]
MIGHFVRPAHSAEIDGVEALELLEPVVGHHLPVLQVVIAISPFEHFDAQVQIPLASGLLQYAQPFGQHFLADTIAGDCGNSVCLTHASVP